MGGCEARCITVSHYTIGKVSHIGNITDNYSNINSYFLSLHHVGKDSVQC